MTKCKLKRGARCSRGERKRAGIPIQGDPTINACQDSGHCPARLQIRLKLYRFRKYTRLAIACYKGQYLSHGCNETDWIRVCRKRADKLDVLINGEETIKLMLKYCAEEEGDAAYNCFQIAVNQMSNSSCPEVIHALNTQNATKE